METLEAIPDSAIGIQIGEYFAEIVQVKDNVIKAVRMWRAEPADHTNETDG